ncbi:hypothetical protein HPP92_012478 [Vanilla planifolia]|uniref:cytokinin dehydrogenase n=1 Tax=Vanilla planifolia TaxID=51239 RepID=A0A835R506_VANPL|nr:hypothetical protein HPP92_012478 [Vanilla planifolia]
MGASPILKLLMALLLAEINSRNSHPDSLHVSFLHSMSLDGQFTFHDVHQAATDFGNRYHLLPSMVLHPGSVSDIAATVRRVVSLGPSSGLTVAARGEGHSLQGHHCPPRGRIVRRRPRWEPMDRRLEGDSAPWPLPMSWTDYLHLSIGGTLSNAGISGQAFRHGPQISNVHQLEVVTGKGEAVLCSSTHNADLFHAVLGGLGQFGIITRARITLQAAPKMVKWIRVLYSDFATFVEDQEMLISVTKTFDYVEGFVIINRTGLLNNWRSSFWPKDPALVGQFESQGRTLFCLEVTKNFDPENHGVMMQEVDELLTKLRYIPSTLFESEVSYLDFLDRVHASELKLRLKGLWEVPHPWLNLLVPKAGIHEFADEVFGKIVTESNNGPILLYPLNKSNWDNRTSAVIPDEEVFFLVAFLSSAPSSSGQDCLARALKQNERILEFCKKANIKAKQYLPYYTTQEDWRSHYGPRWETFRRRKQTYDPLAILAPEQRIFQKAADWP